MSSVAQPRRRADRAAQFMSFAALAGYYDLVREQERVREPRRELTEGRGARLAETLARLRRRDLVRATFYEKDAYVTLEGAVSEIDPAARELCVVRTHIRFDDLWDLEILSGARGSDPTPDDSARRSPQGPSWPRAAPPCAGDRRCGSGRAPAS